MEQEPRTARERALQLLWNTLAIPRWLPTTEAQRLVWAIRLAVIVGITVLIATAVDRPLWDWLELLIIPAVIAGGGIWFNQQQRKRELEIAEQRAQDDTLQAYLDQMSQLLAEEDRPLRKSEDGDAIQGDTVGSLARARTLTALARLKDPDRKRSLLLFLYEANLIGPPGPVIPLYEADLDGANLRDARLMGADLHAVKLGSADLREALLNAANLRGAKLQDAELRDAVLHGASLVAARLDRANLSGAKLQQADLSGANLTGANLRSSDLTNASLRGADAKNADLTGALGVTREQLEAEAASLEGTTMPDGSKHY